jgi:magnesium transporter
MAEVVQSRLEIEDLQQNLSEVQALLRDGQRPGELRGKLDALHPADIAYILEALPPEERLQVWDLVKSPRRRRWRPTSSRISRPTCRRR